MIEWLTSFDFNMIVQLLPMDKITAITKNFGEFVKVNPVVGGIISLWFLGVITFFTRQVPSKLKSIFAKQFTVTLTLDNQDAVFLHFMQWCEEQKFSKKARTIKAQNGQYGESDERVTLSMGYGTHYFRRGFRFFELNRSEKSSDSKDVKESVSITTFGRSQEPLRKLLLGIVKKKSEYTHVTIYKWRSDYWKYMSKQPIRSLDSVVLPKKVKTRILNRIEVYNDDKPFYVNNGIPYTLGIGFHGIPGTGKTSLVKALCGHLKKDLYCINLSNVTDNGLESALTRTPKNAIVLIEDFDSAKVTKARKSVKKQVGGHKGVNPLEGLEEVEDEAEDSPMNMGPTLSGILNAIDGVSSADGRILIMTTNDWGSIDPALKRAGRIDFDIELGPVTSETLTEMLARFYPDFSIPDDIEPRPGLTPAEVQGLVLEHRNSPEQLLKMCLKEE